MGEVISFIFLGIALFFFAAGTMGVLRFPDVYTRLHAMTKADNLGVGFVVGSAMIVVPTAVDRIKLLVIWLLILVAATTAAHLVALRSWEDKR